MNESGSTNSLLGVVLTGGRSARMGQEKALLRHPNGGTFLQHAVNRLAAITTQVCIAGVCDPSDQLGVKVLPDSIKHAGPVTGIVGALTFLDSQITEQKDRSILVTPVDMPWLKESVLNDLVAAWQRNSKLTCLISQSGNRIQPLVAIYRLADLNSLQVLASSDDRSLYRWIKDREHQTVVADDRSCHNVNTPEDLEV